jgi:hypothetical protein
MHFHGHRDALPHLRANSLAYRRAEEDHDSITNELVDGTTVGKRDISHLGKIVIHDD